jgi:hypothetical protein
MFKAAKAGPQKAITANRLDDGRVVFLDELGGWVPTLVEARLLSDGAALEQASAYAKAQHDARIVVEPYAIDVEIVDGLPVPARIRERIRAQGPTVRYGDAEYAALSNSRVPEAAE